MKGNKIIATLVVLAMVLSTLVVLKQFNIVEEASAATPGFDDFGNATTDLGYDPDNGVTISINTTGLKASTEYKLYKPRYNCSTGSVPEKFMWDTDPVTTVTGPLAKFTTDAVPLNKVASLGSVKLDRAGIWILDDDTSHNASSRSSFGAFFWVNTSTAYTISDMADFTFGDSGTKTITVKKGDTGITCLVDLIGPDNNTVFQKWATAGTLTFDIDGNITLAGDYTLRAYKDLDFHKAMYEYSDESQHLTTAYGYDNTYGAGFSSSLNATLLAAGEHWKRSVVGPWDPPEENATKVTFTVGTGEPIITLTNTTIYWGFKTRIDVNVTNSDGIGITNTTAPKTNCTAIKLKHGNTYYDFTDVFINETGNGNYTIEIPRWPSHIRWANWTHLGAIANGTWRVVFANNSNHDDTDEWNNSASFVVKSANPPVQLVIVNDGSETATDKKVNVPAYAYNTGSAGTIAIAFDIFGRSLAGDKAYYGDQTTTENWKNITVEGDILYPVNGTTLVHGTLGRWTATVTPTKPGGTIKLTIDWPGDDNGTASQTIEIVNGTHVTSAVDKFTVGQHYNLTVTVKDMDEDFVKNANVSLMWENQNTQFNHTVGSNKAGNGLNGEYTFWINPTDDDNYPTTAPQNITVAAKWYDGFWGYAKVVMDKNHNMMVNATPTMSYAGDGTTYNIDISLASGGHPTKNTDLHIAIYNSTGDLVTGDDAWSKTNAYDINDEEIILTGGTYYLYAHNLTHDSQGNNATLVITPYTVTSSPSVLAWKIDQSENMTFQLTPAGNGTLTILNMSSLPNCSYLTQETQIDIENGVGTLDEVNATTLGNVTFTYTPEGGAERCADGLLRVTTATATPSPATIFIGEASSVTITITHPATGVVLQGVEVGLDIDLNSTTTILSKLPTNKFTNAQGIVTFAITAEASGNVTIFIENETDPDNEFVIIAAARKQMAISNDPSVDEGKTFTIEAKTNGVLITDATVTFTFNGQTWPTTTGVATITAPSVSTSLTYPITATAEGYTSTSGTIMVLNVPKLIVAISGDVKAGQTFTLTIADDMGGPVIGATVTFEGKTYTTGAGGTITMTAPTTEGSYPVSATFPGFGSASGTVTVLKGGGIPGFELLTLVAAIGVAFLLLRRRRN